MDGLTNTFLDQPPSALGKKCHLYDIKNTEKKEFNSVETEMQ